jgi:hypothetical protein
MKLHPVSRKIFYEPSKFGHRMNSQEEVLHVHRHSSFSLGFMPLSKNDENIFHKYLFLSIIENKTISRFRVGRNFMNFLKQTYVLAMKSSIDYANEPVDNVNIIPKKIFRI